MRSRGEKEEPNTGKGKASQVKKKELSSCMTEKKYRPPGSEKTGDASVGCHRPSATTLRRHTVETLLASSTRTGRQKTSPQKLSMRKKKGKRRRGRTCRCQTGKERYEIEVDDLMS